MRGHHQFAGVLQAHALAHIIKAAAIGSAGHGQRGGGQDRRLQVFKKRLFEDLRNINGRCLQHNMGLSAPRAPPFAAVFDPENGVLVL